MMALDGLGLGFIDAVGVVSLETVTQHLQHSANIVDGDLTNSHCRSPSISISQQALRVRVMMASKMYLMPKWQLHAQNGIACTICRLWSRSMGLV